MQKNKFRPRLGSKNATYRAHQRTYKRKHQIQCSSGVAVLLVPGGESTNLDLTGSIRPKLDVCKAGHRWGSGGGGGADKKWETHFWARWPWKLTFTAGLVFLLAYDNKSPKISLFSNLPYGAQHGTVTVERFWEDGVRVWGLTLCGIKG